MHPRVRGPWGGFCQPLPLPLRCGRGRKGPEGLSGRQGRDLFRREGRSDSGRLKNARYLIRGVVTDFTVTGDSSGWFGTKPARVAGGRSTAQVTLNVKVSDVESGEVLASTRASGTASSGFFGGQVDYRSVSLGGISFSRTPLGRATETAMARAVARILDALPVQYWQPRVADAADGQVVVNGGANVGLRVGSRFAVREPGRAVTDPLTGDAIETLPGRERGRLRIVEVRAASARAELLQGAAERGDVLEPVR